MSAQLPWIILWIGLATLIVGLIVLTRTSWGQSHPLRKCAALSLLVHLLLAAYATTVQIVTAGTTNGNSKNGIINLTMTADPGTTTDQPVNKSDSSALDKPAVDSTLQPTVSFGGTRLADFSRLSQTATRSRAVAAGQAAARQNGGRTDSAAIRSVGRRCESPVADQAGGDDRSAAAAASETGRGRSSHARRPRAAIDRDG